MKNLFLFAFLLFQSVIVLAQGVSLNTNNTPAHASSIFDINSTAKGVLFPRMSTAQRTAIVAPAQGLLVYDIDTRSFWFYDVTWKEISAGGGFSLPYSGTAAYNGKLFSVSNTDNSFNAAAVFGRRGAGSGVGIGIHSGVHGDNAGGFGVAGTSDVQAGVAGFSLSGPGVSAVSESFHGVSAISTTSFGVSSISQTSMGVAGLSNGANMAGVFGVNGNSTGTGYGVIGSIENPTSGAAIWGKNAAVGGNAGYFTITNPNNYQPALNVHTAGNGNAAYFNSAGVGNVVQINHNNPASVNSALKIDNGSNGTGIAVNSNSDNSEPCISVAHSGFGEGIKAVTQSAYAGYFLLNGTNSFFPAMEVETKGQGKAGYFIVNNSNSQSYALHAKTNGSGTAGFFETSSSQFSSIGLQATHTGSGKAAHFNSTSTSNAQPVLSTHQAGRGSTAYFYKSSEANGSGEYQNNPAVWIDNDGRGQALMISAINGVTDASSVDINYAGQGSAIKLTTTNRGIFAKSTSASLYTAWFENINGGGGVYANVNTNARNAVRGINYAHGGIAIFGESENGIGIKGYTNSLHPAIYGENVGGGDALVGVAIGTGNGVNGYIEIDNAFGHAGKFTTHCSSNEKATVFINNQGVGESLEMQCNQPNNNSTMMRLTKNGNGDFLVAENFFGDNKIRFSTSGTGYFNGGVQSSGADIAESFAVENDRDTYEPGDVLIISVSNDRTVAKSNEPYSNLVAGVYATKPGVLLSEDHIDVDLSDEVPMGVIGVIPTKVCLEGGPIRRGDMLVTSSVPGVAMKADPDQVKVGQVLGKALENYNANTIGAIRVLVSIR